MKVYMIRTYHGFELISVQWTKDEELAEVLKRNELYA